MRKIENKILVLQTIAKDENRRSDHARAVRWSIFVEKSALFEPCISIDSTTWEKLKIKYWFYRRLPNLTKTARAITLGQFDGQFS